MLTRSKNGITVPKQLFSLLVHLPPSTGANSFKEAISFPEWRQAMAEEYQALMA